jgi:hypothetical protein
MDFGAYCLIFALVMLAIGVTLAHREDKRKGRI